MGQVPGVLFDVLQKGEFIMDQRRIRIEMSVEDMGRISIALDSNTTQWAGSPEWKKLQERFDRLYRGVHDALAAGVVSLEA